MTDTTSETTNASTDAQTVTDDVRYRMLSDEQRRRTIAVLADRDEPLDVEDLAEAVAAEQATGEPSDTVRSRIAVRLHHCHLPKLSAASLVDYDPSANRVASGQVSLDQLL